MQPPITLTARRPRSIWNAPVESDFGDILASVGKGAAEALLGGPAGVAAAAVDLLRVVRVTKDAGELAWLLVARALGRAIRDAYDSFAGDEAEAGEVEAFVKAVHLFIGERSWPLTPRFFEDPSSVPVVAEVADIFARWLLGRGAAAAEVVAARGEVIVGFAAAISAEWRDEPATYEAIAKALQQPFSLADWTSGLWRGYHDSLRREPDAPLFDEPFTLRDIYIPLRGATRIDANKPPVIRSAADTLHDWLNGSSWRDVLRVVSGGPGSGKSSFMKMFADAAVARNDFAVLFVPLHLFDFNGSLEASLREFARSCGAPPDPLATATRPLLLIFDGLDELEMQGAHGAAVASAFLGDLWKMLGRRNRSERRVFAIVTGREILLQTVEHMVDAATVVTLLPFLVDDPKAYGDPEELGRLDQREEWWKRYGQLTGRGYGGLPAPLAGRELDELTAQPLLTYAVATAYAAGKLRLEGNVNQNSVYGDLLAAVYERRWASGQHPAARTITTLAAFERVLQEIAAAAWSGNRRSTTVGDIRDRAKRCGHSIPLSAFEAAEEEGLTRFLTAFYFRYRSSTDEPQRTFEFTHKSFSEYLTARWIVAALEELSTHDRGAAAVDFITLFGDLPLDRDLLPFFKREIERLDATRREHLRQFCAGVLTIAVRFGLPVEKLPVRRSHRAEATLLNRAGTIALAFVSLAAGADGQRHELELHDHYAFAEWLQDVAGHRGRSTEPIVLRCLGHLSIDECDFQHRDLWGANLSRSNLRKASFRASILTRAELNECGLSGAIFHDTMAREAQFERSKLTEASIQNAIFEHARMKRALLNESTCLSTRFDHADLSGASFHRAHLQNCTFTYASLAGADFTRATISGPISHADFAGANLSGADLRKAVFIRCNFHEAALSGARVTEATFADSELTRAQREALEMENLWPKTT